MGPSARLAERVGLFVCFFIMEKIKYSQCFRWLMSYAPKHVQTKWQCKKNCSDS